MDNQGLTSDQPKWIQEIAERESKATKGPWDTHRCGYALQSRATGEELLDEDYDGDSGTFVKAEDAVFCAHARTDVPRLVEASFGLAEALAALILYGCVAGSGCHVCDTDDDRCYLDDRCYVRGAERALAKYRGEVDADA